MDDQSPDQHKLFNTFRIIIKIDAYEFSYKWQVATIEIFQINSFLST